MIDRPKPKLTVAQRVFMAGVRYGLRHAAKVKRRDVEDLMDETEISAAEALRQALDGDDDPDSRMRWH